MPAKSALGAVIQRRSQQTAAPDAPMRPATTLKVTTSPAAVRHSVSPSPSANPQLLPGSLREADSLGVSPLIASRISYAQHSMDPEEIQRLIVHNLKYNLGRSQHSIDRWSAYMSAALAVRTHLIDAWNSTQQHFTDQEVKFCNYLSLEWLMGRAFQNALLSTGLHSTFRSALKSLGIELENLYEAEHDAALGNGGLGRLAACFIDSMATQNYPCWGYGLRYTYGMFTQQIVNGFQVEHPEYWLTYGNPWEVRRLDICYPVRFGGHVRREMHNGEWRFHWEGGSEVTAIAYDTLVPGYGTDNVLNLRLWAARPQQEFDLTSFGQGNFYHHVSMKQEAGNLTAVLYPNDSTHAGRLLRLKQEYFFVSATIQDILVRFDAHDLPLERLHEFHTIQLNDTHPAIGVAELIRILVDLRDVEWTRAFDIAKKVFNYTNHTVLPEALEKWDLGVFEEVLPRHIEIIYEINHRYLSQIRSLTDDVETVRALSIIQENPRALRMANLAIIGSAVINGVAAIHSQIVKDRIFEQFYRFHPEMFQNKTNGVTPRRWILQANPRLALLIERCLGNNEWLRDLSLLRGLEPFSLNEKCQVSFLRIKKANKARLAAHLKATVGVEIPDNFLFDIQIKRIHEYKRQLMNILATAAYYFDLREGRVTDPVPRAVIIGGKAAPGYQRAKEIIKLINAVADVINADLRTRDYLRVCFVPNYNVSQAELLIPASDISEHISTAGTEASGTGNMKFVMNGGLLLATHDGASIEIDAESPGACFFFGLKKDEVEPARTQQREDGIYEIDSRLQRVITALNEGIFGSPDLFSGILSSLTPQRDFYLVARDFTAYMESWNEIDALYREPYQWAERCIKAISGMGFFSSDRTIHEYAADIWGIQQCEAPPAPHAPPMSPTRG